MSRLGTGINAGTLSGEINAGHLSDGINTGHLGDGTAGADKDAGSARHAHPPASGLYALCDSYK